MVELFHNTKRKNVRRCIVKYTEQHASLLYYTTCLASGVISHSQYISKTFTVSAAAVVVVGKKEPVTERTLRGTRERKHPHKVQFNQEKTFRRGKKTRP